VDGQLRVGQAQRGPHTGQRRVLLGEEAPLRGRRVEPPVSPAVRPPPDGGRPRAVAPAPKDAGGGGCEGLRGRGHNREGAGEGDDQGEEGHH